MRNGEEISRRLSVLTRLKETGMIHALNSGWWHQVEAASVCGGSAELFDLLDPRCPRCNEKNATKSGFVVSPSSVRRFVTMVVAAYLCPGSGTQQITCTWNRINCALVNTHCTIRIKSYLPEKWGSLDCIEPHWTLKWRRRGKQEEELVKLWISPLLQQFKRTLKPIHTIALPFFLFL